MFFTQKIYIFLFAFLIGVFFHSLFLNFIFIPSLLVFFFLLIGIFAFSRFSFLQFFAIFLFAFLLGFFRFEMSIHRMAEHQFDSVVKQKLPLVFEALIDSRPLRAGQLQKFSVRVDKVFLGDESKKIHTRFFLTVPYQESFHYADRIRFSGILKKPDVFLGDNGRVFDYRHYLEKDKIYYTMKTEDVRVIGQEKNMLFFLYQLKESLLKKIYRYLPRPESSLLAGILLGEKTALGDKLENDFRNTGLMHIVVLSGYNVSIIIMAVMFMLSFLPLYSRSFIAILLIILFALLVGAGPTVVRASLMAFFMVLARVLGTSYRVERVLVLAGFLMVVINPWVLFYDISFQFSFLATYGLIRFMPFFEKILSFLPNKFFLLRESAAATLSAQLMVLPLIIYYIGDISFVSPFVNMLVLFIIPPVMAFGFFTALFAFISHFIATILAFPTTFLLKYILFVVHTFASLPFAKFVIPPFSFFWIFIYYFMLFSIPLFIKKNEKRNE